MSDVNNQQKEKIQDKQRDILLAELGALIHDIGKLTQEFISEKSENGPSTPSQWHHHAHIFDFDNKTFEEKKFKDLDKDIELEFTDIAEGHHENRWGKVNIKDYSDSNNNAPFLIKLICAADKFDSGEDKGNTSNEGKQEFGNIIKINAFGEEDKKIETDKQSLERRRKEVYDKINNFIKEENFNNFSKRKELLRDIEKNLSQGLGETRRSANDVSLWEHSYMSTSIFKTLIGEHLLNENFRKRIDEIKGEYKQENNGDKTWKWNLNGSIKDIIKENYPFKIISIGWEHFEFLKQSQKLPDVIGREKVVEQIKDELKEKIEVEYCLGNSIYEDESQIHFLIPTSFQVKKLNDEIYGVFNEKTHGILSPYFYESSPGGSLITLLNDSILELNKKIERQESNFEPGWHKDWEGNNGKLICNNCRKSFYLDTNDDTNNKICETCDSIREKGREDKEEKQTRFMSELSWDIEKGDYNNVALFTLNFNMENWMSGEYIKDFLISDSPSRKLKDKDGLKGKLNAELKGNFEWNENIKNLIIKGLNSWLNEKLTPQVVANKDVVEVFIRNLQVSLKTKTLKEILDSPEEVAALLPEEIYLLNENEIKTPSPSRIMRVWKTTHDFFEEIKQEVIDETTPVKRYKFGVSNKSISNNITPNAGYKAKLKNDNEMIEGEVFFDENNYMYTITPHLKIKEYKKVEITHPDTKNHLGTYNVESKQEIQGPKQIRVISTSPTQCMFFVPANKTMEILSKLKEKYEKKLGKAYGKLPLNIGITFGKRRTPLFIYLDTARRFVKEFEKKKEAEEFCVCSNKEGDKVTKLCLEKDSKNYSIKVPNKLGNNEIDYYHPYMLIKDNDSSDSRKLKHVTKIKPCDKIKLHPNNFDFELLDTNTRRFDVVLNENKEREHPISHNNPRPYMIENLDDFITLKQIFDTIGAWSPIRDIEAIASEKMGWNGEGSHKTYEDFIETLLENKISRFFKSSNVWNWNNLDSTKPMIKDFLKKSIVDGTFFDAVELYKTILKQDVGGNND